MERLFQQNFYTFFLEFKQFRFYFYKTLTSFTKLIFNLFLIILELFRCFFYLLFNSSSLYKWHSPTKRTIVERQYTMPHNRMY